jgi:hypothetical protein
MPLCCPSCEKINNLTPGCPGAENIISGDGERMEQEHADKQSVPSQRTGAQEKKFTNEATNLLKTKDSRTN